MDDISRTILAGALTALSSFPAGSFAHAECQLGRLAEIPVTMNGLRPTIVVKINGLDTNFILDSGAFYSTLSPAKASELKLPLSPAPYNFSLEGIGGHTSAQIATVKELTIFNVKIPNVQFIVGGSEPGNGLSGLLGQNFLRIADVEYDLANGVIRLIRPKGCDKAVLVYWASAGQPYSEMTINWATRAEPHTTGTVLLNGAKIRAVFDTGAATSFISLRAAERAGIKPDQPGVERAGFSHGIGSELVQTWIAPFASFKVGDEEIRNARLRIGDFGLSIGDMLIGADFFLSHHVYVASSQHKLYFTYNGGPVFNLRQSPLSAGAKGGSPAGGNSVAQGGSPAAGKSSPTDGASAGGPQAVGSAAAGSAREGDVGKTTTDAGSAPADDGTLAAGSAGAVGGAATAGVGAAAGVVGGTATGGGGAAAGGTAQPPDPNEPKDADGFSRRGEAFAARRDFAHALADLTRAVELNPNEPSYFYERGVARMQNSQPQLAAEDFDQALKLKPDDVRSLVARAQMRLAKNDPTGAVSDIDSAQQAATKEADVRFQLGAMYGRAGQFTAAIAQYDLWIPAHRNDSRMGEALSDRGVARALAGQDFRQSIADQNAALRLRPHEPRFLGWRAFAELKAGNPDKAISDWDAVLAIQPKNAWALYGRGVAKLRKGNTSEGQADIAAATALQPRIAEVAQKQGMTP